MMTNELSQYKVGFEEGSRLAGKPTQTSDDSNLVDEAAVAAAAGSTSMAAPVPLVGLGLAAAVPSDALSGASSFGSLKGKPST